MDKKLRKWKKMYGHPLQTRYNYQDSDSEDSDEEV